MTSKEQTEKVQKWLDRKTRSSRRKNRDDDKIMCPFCRTMVSEIATQEVNTYRGIVKVCLGCYQMSKDLERTVKGGE